MRLVPRSLYVRLALTLAVVLSVAQLLSAMIHFQERDRMLYYTAGLNSAERIAGYVRLLDPLMPEERRRAVDALSVPPLSIALTDSEWKPDSPGQHLKHARLFHQFLHAYLSKDRPLSVWVREIGEDPGARQPSGTGDALGWQVRGMHERMHGEDALQSQLVSEGNVSRLTQVQLGDGTWVSIDEQLPEEIFAWPYKLFWSLSLLLASVIVVTLIAVRWLTKPLEGLARAADELGRDIRRPPLPESGPTEVRRAAHAFNRMQARILRFLEDRFRIMAAVSHDLKTPITRLRLRAEMLEDDILKKKICRDLTDMKDMVQGALDFMRGIESDEATQSIDVNALLDSLLSDAEDSGHRMQIEGEARSPYPGRPLSMKRCLSNLLDNALKYGGQARVQITDSAQSLVIRIVDEGPGIPEQELERVFEPFYRLEISRSRETGGTGLGLSIARNIARGHGGELVLRNRPRGGLEATLTLPREIP